MSKDELLSELQFCLKVWKKKGGCTFGGKTYCEQCASPYLLLKMINGELLHGEMKRLTLDDWNKKLKSLEK